MADHLNSRPGKPTLKTVPLGDTHVDYSYDQWRHAQMLQLEHNYAAIHGHNRKAAVA